MDLEDIEYMHGCLSRSCDMYLDELRDEISKARGKHLSLSTIWRTLHRTGYPRKKITREARERNLDKHAEYMYRVGIKYRPDRLIFIDESFVDCHPGRRGYGYSKTNIQALQMVFLFVDEDTQCSRPLAYQESCLWISLKALSPREDFPSS